MWFLKQRNGWSLSVAVVFLLVTIGGAGSSAVAQERTTEGRAGQEAASDKGYRIGPGDLLSLGVYGVKGFDQTTRVSNSGKIHIPYLGILRVTDMTPSQLEAEIARMLRERRLVKEPWVTVRVAQYRSQPVYILGEVMLPGQFVITDEMYLIDLITLGGGFNDVASSVGYLYRRQTDAENLPKDEAPTDQAIPIDFKALNEGTRPDLNVKLRGGDVLYVPQRRQYYFFVVGDVRAPGSYPMNPEDSGPTLTLSLALSMAGGPLRTAKLTKGAVVHFDQDGTRQELPADFDAILRGRQPDVPVRPNDIIFIPGSASKMVGYGLLGAIPRILTGALIFR